MTERITVSKKLVIINSASSLATRLLSISVLIWLQQYLLKRISPEEYSLLPILYSLIMFAPLVVAVLAGGLKRYVLEAYAKHDDYRITQLVSTMLPLLCVAAISLFVLGVTLAWNVDRVFRIPPEYVDDARVMLILLVCSAAIQLPLEAYSSGLFVRQRFVLQNLIELGAECFRISALFALLFGVSTSVVWVVVATVLGDLTKFTSIALFSRRMVPSQRFYPSRINWSIARDLTTFGGWSSLDGFCGMIRKAADAIILNRLATPLDVACFHLGALVPNRMEVIINQSFTKTVAPVVIGMHSLQQEERLKGLYLRLGRLALWGILLAITPLVAYHEQIIRLYVGDTYLPAATVMVLLLACYPIVYGNILHTGLAKAKVRMRSLAVRNSVSASANLLLTLLLVGLYDMGALGAAVATFVTYGVGSLLLLWPLGKNLIRATWSEAWRHILLPGLTPFVVTLFAMKGLTMALPVDSWGVLAINSVLGGIVYLAVLWFVMQDIDKLQLKEFIKYFSGIGRRGPSASIG